MSTISASALWLITSAAAGIIAHHGLFIQGEWHLRVPRIVFTHLALACIVWSFVSDESKDPAGHLRLCLLVFTSYLASLFSSISVYRIFFHRLRAFPGPKLAAFTKFWHVFQARNSTNHLVLQDLHHRYGTFVRTGEKAFPTVMVLLRHEVRGSATATLPIKALSDFCRLAKHGLLWTRSDV
jgi:hypothetical protein